MAKVRLSDRLSSVGEYYFSKKLQEIAEVRAAGNDVISLAIGSPDMPPANAVRSALARTAARDDTHGYQVHNGTPSLRAALAEFYKCRYGVTLDPACEVLPLLGSKEAILHITMAFTNPGDVVLAPNPGYGAYTNVAKLLHVTPVPYNLTEGTGWQPDVAEIEKLLEEAGGRAKVLWVNYPHMPTGAEPREGLFEDLAGLCMRYGVLLVNDNPYSLVLPTDSSSPISMLPRVAAVPGARDFCLELNSLSKSHCMPGWRVGLAVGAAPLVKAVLQVKSNFDSGMFLAVQDAARCALTEVSSAFFYEVNAEYSARREVVFTLLRHLGCTFSRKQVGMFVWARAPDSWGCVRSHLDALFAATHVFITPGFIFGSNGERYVRVSLCCPISRLREASQRIKQYTSGRVDRPHL
eukprot:TRINITY_DN2910_c1_g5_i1.p1 TRINITY_DN2910_c1_g5~~TRINITY_DN2910_c1_g5_i1.p1  ORF type:complete len:408 (+),score=124.11 TRINITY_DN2910_c1_g5_i1:225-1448(+)